MISARSKITIGNLQRALAEEANGADRSRLMPDTEAEELKSFADRVRLRKLRALDAEKKQEPRSESLAAQQFCEIAQTFKQTICDNETGILSFPALLFMLEQEYHRAYRSNSALSVMIIKIRVIKGRDHSTSSKVLPLSAQHTALARICKTKRHIDLLGHFGQDRLALVLPQTAKVGAKRFANKLIDKLLESALVDGLRPTDLDVSLGIATAPADGQNLSVLLARAEAAQVKAEETQTRVGIFVGS